MRNTDMSEKGFQNNIIKYLLEKNNYIQTYSDDFDRELCINKNELLEFIKLTQDENYDFIIRKDEKEFFNRLDNKIKKDGIIEVLRKGMKHFDKTIYFFYPQPNSIHNPNDKFKYESNIFSVTEELVYSDNNKNRIDLVIFINGLPIITIELKNAYTNQAVKNAIIQYRKDRDPKDKIFNFARCIVHFAMDTDLVYMSTKIDGLNTNFMPFNKGLNDGKPYPPFGAGNPLNPNREKTSYMWEEILTKESLANIIDKFVQIEKPKEKSRDKTKLIFPRYHQLKVVKDLLNDSKENGIGKRYLIQHSAGSGKSNSITWLAHQLTELYDKNNINSIFDSVVVVTDRTVLDTQIRENIKSFAQVRNILEAITGNATDIKRMNPKETSFSKTTHMRLALENNKKIITCTVQTFPYVLKSVSEAQNKKIAFIIDEAHSSQSGSAAASMNALFSGEDIMELKQDEDGNINTEDLVNYLVGSRKMLKNASYFAFTATPKNKTLETFGIKQADGTFKSFHNYSMKQAIEEEYILDVLENYTTYKSYYKIKADSDALMDKKYETKQANKKLKSFIEGNEIAINEKSKIMIDHFHKNINKRINNRAKAMIVTQTIETAMKYKDSFDNYLKETNLPYKAIVAFSGKKAHYKTGIETSENDMNDFEDNKNNIPEQFKKDEYKFLIVANKYQTGFDEKLLHTMYVDKKLSGVQAVQTLSRLNRAYKPYKTDTIVVDFFNRVEDIKNSFEPYYTSTVLSEETDVNKLNDIEEELDKTQIYDSEDIDDFFKVYYTKLDRTTLEVIINKVVANFNEEEKEIKIKFKSNAKSFVRTYNYLSKIIEYNVNYWEKLSLFLKHLIPKLKIDDAELDENILEEINLESYRVNIIGNTKINFEVNEGTIDPIPVKTGGGLSEKQMDTLSNIVSEFNKRFGAIDWGNDVNRDEVEKILVEEIPDRMKKSIETINSIKNSDKYNAKHTSDEKVEKIMEELMYVNTEIFRKFSDDDDFKNRYLEFVFDMMWDERNNSNAQI